MMCLYGAQPEMTNHRRRRAQGGVPFRWEGVEVQTDHCDGGATSFKDLSRQVLFDDSCLDYQVHFFDLDPGGRTTLERHKEAQSVVVLGGRGECLVGDYVIDLVAHDLVDVGPWEWHQFRAAPDDHLGLLCILNDHRDRPQLPNSADLERLTRFPEIAAFLRLSHPGGP